jgi:hypothetical protein
MRYDLIYIFLLSWLLSACTQPRVDGTRFSETKELVAEKIPIGELFSADWVTKSGDYFIISNYKSDTTLFLYEVPSLTFKKATGIKGGGPDDVVTFPMFAKTTDNDFLYIKGYSHKSIRKIKIEPDGSFSFIDEYLLGRPVEHNWMNIIKDSLLVYYDINGLAIRKYDLKRQNELGEIKLKKEDHNESYFYSNRGVIAANDSFIVHPYIYKKQIDIYAVEDLKLAKRINDGKDYPNVFPLDFESITDQYINIYAGKKYFYVIHIGHKEEDDDYSKRTLEVYDYKGNPIIKYTFDIVPFYYVVDEEKGYIYATNSDYEDYLLRYKL